MAGCFLFTNDEMQVRSSITLASLTFTPFLDRY